MINSETERIIKAPFFSKSLPVQALHDREWDLVPRIAIRQHWSGEPAPATRHADAQVCWNDEALNVRFVCMQSEPLIVVADPATHQKTLRLWERDVCEIFLAPEPHNPFCYFEFEAAPTGEWLDLGIVITESGRETMWDYNSGMTTAAEIIGERLTIGMRIPWSESIRKPKAGDKWRANVFRCVGPESESRYLAWQPTKTREPNFHVPEAFGWLLFMS